MPGRHRQHPAGRVPSGSGQERRIDLLRQPGGLPIEDDPGQDAAELAAGTGTGITALLTAGPGNLWHRQPEHGTGHDVNPASSRGLGTASTAARSRAESGCR